MQKFENVSNDMDNDERWKAACRIVSKKMVRDNLALRKKCVGEFLKTIKTISQQSFSVKMGHILYPVSHIFMTHHTKILQ